jgi:hypothetical protein
LQKSVQASDGKGDLKFDRIAYLSPPCFFFKKIVSFFLKGRISSARYHFDTNILTIATGLEEHNNYAVEVGLDIVLLSVVVENGLQVHRGVQSHQEGNCLKCI